MKRLVILFIALCSLCFSVKAQDYVLLSFGEMEGNSMIAREHMMEDENGRKCAVICVSTQDISPEMRSGFHFESDWGSYIVQRSEVGAEIRIWVSPGLKTLKVMHATLGNIEVAVTKHVPRIESLHTYRMVLKGTVAPTGPQLAEDEQYLQFNVKPLSAWLLVDDQIWPLKEGMAQQVVKRGKHHFRVEASGYHGEEGDVLMDDLTYAKVMKVNLKPAFGFLRIDDAHADLSAASIYIDDDTIAHRYNDSLALQLGSGQHQLRVMHPGYRSYTSSVTIFDERTTVVSPRVKTTFVTLDYARGGAPQNSFGFTFGSVKRLGWFVTAASNFSFEALSSNHYYGPTEDGFLVDITDQDGTYWNSVFPDYTGESCTSRLSIMAGLVFRIADPVYMKVGAGYGARVKGWYLSQGGYVTVLPESYQTFGSHSCGGVDTTLGLQLNFKHISVGLDAVVGLYDYYGLKQMSEVKIGIGYNWKTLK